MEPDAPLISFSELVLSTALITDNPLVPFTLDSQLTSSQTIPVTIVEQYPENHVLYAGL
jgi:hypothetical protein